MRPALGPCRLGFHRLVLLSGRVLRRNGQRAGLLISLAIGLVVSLVVSLGLVSAPALADETAGDPEPSTSAATAALTEVQALLDPDATDGARVAAAPAHRDLTFALRDLRLRKDDLSTADRATASRLLARPSADRTRQQGSVLVHWQSGTGVRSGYVDLVLKTVNHVLATYKKAGYRAPESDGSRGGGGSGLLDIYLEDLGSQATYGYCDSDQAPPGGGPYDTWAYCAFDDNFDEFPSHTPTQNLQVTAAHELFHAVQFAYDYDEDQWFMEATATWAEDEVYDNVDDNRQYLAQSPLGQPRQPMDQFIGLRQYGDWIFFRFLTEKFPDSQGGMPTLVRHMWKRADGSAGGPDDYSLEAIKHVLASHHTSMPRVFAKFADGNRHPARTYSEGKHYRPAPLAQKRKLSKAKPGIGWQQAKLNHLTSRTTRLAAGGSLRGGKRLTVELDLPDRATGSAAVITTYRVSGAPRSRYVQLSKSGNATKTVGFDSRFVKAVEVTLVNGGTSYRSCWQGTDFSCQGHSTDDSRTVRLRAKVKG